MKVFYALLSIAVVVLIGIFVYSFVPREQIIERETTTHILPMERETATPSPVVIEDNDTPPAPNIIKETERIVPESLKPETSVNEPVEEPMVQEEPDMAQ